MTVTPIRLDERTARTALALASEPGDTTTGALLAANPARKVVALALDPSTPVNHNGIGPAQFALWRIRLAARIDPDAARLFLDKADRDRQSLLLPGDPHWPTALADLGDAAPITLWAKGDPALLDRPGSIALVGARAATGYGEHVTTELATGLVDRGRAIVSGAAYGIDGAAHRATLTADGDTIAILAGGLDRYYPAGHERLIERIADHGLVISEMPPGVSPNKTRFLARNRLIAALTAATVVVEAGPHSGSLNTAHHARKLNRPLGAVPGPITSAASAGCHLLLREGSATAITNADDILALDPR